MTTDTQNTNNPNELITLVEAGERYGFDSNYLGQLARRGRLKAKKYGPMWLTTPADVEDYIRTRQKSGFYREDIQIEEN
ncbi:MAG TPA: hypothetical protein VLL52_13595 [Anaerolineae bacterium]|nr:hypothetical protein [Anaerolineae bacterium]